jgi:hypothetical protein
MNNIIQKISRLITVSYQWSQNNPKITIAIVFFIIGFVIGTLV